MDDLRVTNLLAPLPRPPEVPLVRFTMRQMLLFVAAVSVLCMVLRSIGGYGAIVVSVGIVLVGGHVLSTVIGTRLRAGADAIRQWQNEHEGPSPPHRRCRWIAPASELQIRTAPGRVLWAIVGGGVLAGALLGPGVLKILAGPQVGWPGMIVGSVSTAMLVGWVTFLAANFIGIARRTWRGLRK